MRSVPGHSFARLSSLESLWRAWQLYARGKRRWPAVAAFSLDADTHVLDLHRELDDGTYQPGPYHQHVVRDPKIRLISAPAIRDRVLHQAVVGEMGPCFVRGYIHDSYACLPGRGPQRAVLRYLAWTRRYAWRLALDIRRYFMSVHHPTLLELVFRRLRDHDTRALVRALIASGAVVYRTELARQVLGLEADPILPDTGLPIGSCLSQWAANFYLDGADQFVKRVLRVRGYLRYMDDLVLFSDHRDQLCETRAALTAWLRDERRLELKLGCGHIVPAAQPSTYLGYRVSRAGISPGRKLRRRMRGKLRQAARRGSSSLFASLESYQALVTFG